jgi:hypothetical protein
LIHPLTPKRNYSLKLHHRGCLSQTFRAKKPYFTRANNAFSDTVPLFQTFTKYIIHKPTAGTMFTFHNYLHTAEDGWAEHYVIMLLVTFLSLLALATASAYCPALLLTSIRRKFFRVGRRAICRIEWQVRVRKMRMML